MKRGLKILAIMIATFILTTNVEAEESITYNITGTGETFYNSMQKEIERAYEIIKTNNKEYYMIWGTDTNEHDYIEVYEWDGNKDSGTSINFSQDLSVFTYSIEPGIPYTITRIRDDGVENTEKIQNSTGGIGVMLDNGLTIYDSNTNWKYEDSIYTIEYTGFYEDKIIIRQGSVIPVLKDLYMYNSWSEYEQEHLEGYTEVNLDNYKYVLLSLKDYNQTQAFQTNLQVKGQIGITPIYNFGQTSKDSITGVQVQDRCNIAYENYTSYPFYILQSDLQNNSIYAVKECSNGSSFKFDNTVFDVTYITAENKDNPTITIGGKTYNVIPYKDLPSTATKNEEENYIPGESGSASDTGGLDSAIKNVQQKMSEIWNTFTYFTDFINQLFTTLPIEVKTILLSAFTIAIILGLIKIFIGK